MIDDSTCGILVPYEGYTKVRENLVKSVGEHCHSYTAVRKLQPYMVNVYLREFKYMLGAGTIKEIVPGSEIYELVGDRYDDEQGLMLGGRLKTENKINYRVYGRRALFSDPITRVGGEKCSYPIPTYEALKGITDSIYWKPTFNWIIDRVRIMNPIRVHSEGIRILKYNDGKGDMSYYSYLTNVDYEVQAHFEWNMQRSDMQKDRDENKHFDCANRYVRKGGKFDVFLGVRECQAYVEECRFGARSGAYDTSERYDFGLMFHGFDYPSQTGNDKMVARFWNPVMEKGIIEFKRPEECAVRKFVRNMSYSESEEKGDARWGGCGSSRRLTTASMIRTPLWIRTACCP